MYPFYAITCCISWNFEIIVMKKKEGIPDRYMCSHFSPDMKDLEDNQIGNILGISS